MFGENGLVTGIRASSRCEATSIASTSGVRELSTKATCPSGRMLDLVDDDAVVGILEQAPVGFLTVAAARLDQRVRCQA